MPFVRDARTALLIVDMDNDNCTGTQLQVMGFH